MAERMLLIEERRSDAMLAEFGGNVAGQSSRKRDLRS